MKPINHYPVIAKFTNGEKGPMIELSQEYGCDYDTCSVCLHPSQIRSILDQFGLIATDQESAKKIATLERRLLALRERIDSLHDYLCNHSDHKHADLTWEMIFTTATLDIANEFCEDLYDSTEYLDDPIESAANSAKKTGAAT